jgi:hypothetical protein
MSTKWNFIVIQLWRISWLIDVLVVWLAVCWYDVHWSVFRGYDAMVFNATFNNISVISWRSDLFVEETRVPCGNHRPVVSYWQMLSLNFIVCLMVFNATFNTISDKFYWWRTSGISGENHRPVTSHWQTLLHNVVSSKTTDLSQVTDKLYHIMLYRVKQPTCHKSLTNIIT